MDVKILLFDTTAASSALYNLLRRNDYDVVAASSSDDAIDLAAAIPFRLALVDCSSADDHDPGLEVCRNLRGWSDVPIVLLSSASQTACKLAAFDAGANDYIVRPFDASELLARLRSHLRRSSVAQTRAGRLQVANLSIDIAHGRVHRDEVEIRLSPTEFALLKCLALHRGRVMTHEKIMQEVWGSEKERDLSLLRVYVRRLRRKLESPGQTTLIVTECGLGYSLRG